MHLKDLKLALSKFPAEMDDAELLIQTAYKGALEYDLLSFVAILPLEEVTSCLVFGSLEATRVLVKQKKLRVPDDYVPGGDDEIQKSV